MILFKFIAGNHVCVHYLTLSWHPHRVNFTRRAPLRLIFPTLAPEPGSTTNMFLVSTPVCEWIFVYTPISPSLRSLQRSRDRCWRRYIFRVQHRINSADMVFLPTRETLQQWHGYGHQVRVPPRTHIRTTDGSSKAQQHLRPLTNSRLMLPLLQSPAMGHLLISLSPATRLGALRQHNRLESRAH